MASSTPLDAKKERLRRIIKTRSLMTGGEFTLASGKQSGFFFDMKQTMLDPEGISLIAELVFDRVRSDPEVKLVGGIELGAVPIIVAVVRESQLAFQPVSGFIVRKEKKGHGTDNAVEGILEPDSPVILFEDVTTTGGSITKAITAARAKGCTVKKVITLVDRLEGARDNLAKLGVTLDAIFTRQDFVE